MTAPMESTASNESSSDKSLAAPLPVREAAGSACGPQMSYGRGWRGPSNVPRAVRQIAAAATAAATTTTTTTPIATTRTSRRPIARGGLLLLAALLCQFAFSQLHLWSHWPPESSEAILLGAEAVAIQRLNVPDLVVIDQQNQQQQPMVVSPSSRSSGLATGVDQQSPRTLPQLNSSANQPEAASLINSHDLAANEQSQQSQITFECLISFDKRKDKNLVVKWHHDDRTEPIYQWIPELNKRSIAPQYRAYIAPIVSSSATGQDIQHSFNATPNAGLAIPNAGNQTQLLEAGFKLVRPSKELGGKYTCSAISAQNDDSRWKKMIVFTPPRVFSFNASRAELGPSTLNRFQQFNQQTMANPTFVNPANQQQLPLAYRMRGFDSIGLQQTQLQQQAQVPTTVSPQLFSTPDYVNLNYQRSRQSSPWLSAPPPTQLQPNMMLPSSLANTTPNQRFGQMSPSLRQGKQHLQTGVKLICDIDQVFPVPEVNIYRLAKLDGSHPDKLTKLDTKIERDSLSGLYHVQVMSILDDDELQMKYGLNEPVYFECSIALTNLELSKYADNKRSIVYRPGHLTKNSLGLQTSEDINLEIVGNSANSIVSGDHLYSLIISVVFSTICLLLNSQKTKMMH